MLTRPPRATPFVTHQPILYDTKTNTIVNNESSDILRILNGWDERDGGRTIDLYPLADRQEIDRVNELTYEPINNGVYKVGLVIRSIARHNAALTRALRCARLPLPSDQCGFATTQDAYNEAAVRIHSRPRSLAQIVDTTANPSPTRPLFPPIPLQTALFAALSECDGILSRQRWIANTKELSEADIRLFMTLIRFDPVYVVYFKTNLRMIKDFVHLRDYVLDILATYPEVACSVNMDHIRTHYFCSHPKLNAYAIIPLGPEPWWEDVVRPSTRSVTMGRKGVAFEV